MTHYHNIEEVLVAYEKWLNNGADDEHSPERHAVGFVAEDDPILVLPPMPGHSEEIPWGKSPEPPKYKHDFRLLMPGQHDQAFLDLQEELDRRAAEGWEILSVASSALPNAFYVTSRRPA